MLELRTGQRLRCSVCDCRGVWRDNGFIADSHTITPVRLCTDCNRKIDPRRLEIKPKAAWCIDCAEEHAGGQSRRFIDEPLGTREDFLRDRRSFKTLSR